MLPALVQTLRTRRTRRHLLALLTALTLAPSIGELHTSHPITDFTGAPSTVAVAALHARQAAHLESSETAVRPACSACLLQRQPLDVAAAARVATVGRLPSAARCATERSAPAGAPRDPSIPRAPPFA
jgi:hypothetical protein